MANCETLRGEKWKVVLTQKITKCNAENYYNQGNELCALPDNDDVHADNGGDGDDGTENGSNQRNVTVCSVFSFVKHLRKWEHLNI